MAELASVVPIDPSQVNPAPIVVIDTRLARPGSNSGISRFIMGLSQALIEELAARQERFRSTQPIPKILFVSKHEPPAWIVEIVRRHPTLASFWSGGPGAFAKDLEKPVYAWSSMSLGHIDDLSGGNFYWIAPGNFDRPLLFFSKRKRALEGRLIQVIHDAIPFFQKEGMGFFFRWQFKMIVKRTLAKLPLVFTVSDHSAAQLKSVVTKRTEPVHVLSVGIEKAFGSFRRSKPSELAEKRREFLISFNPELAHPSQSGLLEKVCNMKWVVGVGRSQKYKRWDLAMAAVVEAGKRVSNGALFMRCAATREEVAELNDGSGQIFGNGLLLQNKVTLAFPGLSDVNLAQMYRLSDALIHPSLAEGFGFPPIEAAVSGTPVVFAAGTAVEGHFHQNSLPENFWKCVTGNTLEDWTNALTNILNGDEKTRNFFAEMDKAASTREFVMRFAARRFDWRDSAVTVLSAVTGGK